MQKEISDSNRNYYIDEAKKAFTNGEIFKKPKDEIEIYLQAVAGYSVGHSSLIQPLSAVYNHMIIKELNWKNTLLTYIVIGLAVVSAGTSVFQIYFCSG